MGEVEDEKASAAGGAVSWITGGILVGLAIVVFALDTKGPPALRKAR
jgi:hypothetical protein